MLKLDTRPPTTGGATAIMDSVNRAAWRTPATISRFARLSGWTDPGEEAALALVADEVRNQPILDLGVGAGRTVSLLRSLSTDYIALDYTPELVVACRRRHPEAVVVDGDARDLSRFADGSFKLVVFSFNGIDAVSHQDRLVVLREARRVLRPDGIFVFSAHNRHGPGHGEKLSLGVFATKNPFKLGVRVATALLHLGRTLRNRRKYARLNEVSAEHSIMNAAAHDHGLMIHYISHAAQLAQLEQVGFRKGSVVFGNLDAKPIASGDDTSAVWWFHFVARC